MKQTFTLFLFLLIIKTQAQVNGYAKVTLIAVNALTVSNSNETYGQFTAGQQVIVMQMQDNVIGSNTSNNSNFGNLSSIAQAGKYEVATVLLVARTGLLPTVITLTAPLTNSYNIGANSSVQIITYPTLGTGNYSTTTDITALPWDGNIGGVVAFNVNGTLTLNNNISADNAGFNGGAPDASSSPYGTCNSTDYYHAVDALYGNKGEGIYKNTNANYTSGMGKMLNGGGGGNTINSGGGGGSNYTGGGIGSIGWSCTVGSTGGIGGIALNTNISGNRVFMGGGGGSGEANDNYNDKGGNGGGIVLISAQAIKTTGTGSAVRISANGQAGNSVGNDGAGGGGAGGSVVLNVIAWNIAAGRPLTIAANGGNGGDVGNSDRHGGGGGGGQGVVLFSSMQPVTNITTTTTNGTGGLNFTGGTHAASGSGTNNSGIVSLIGIALPLKLVSFTAVKNNDYAVINWITTDEVNVSHFDVQRSTDGVTFETIGSRVAVGNSQATEQYSFPDPKAIATTTYYRLQMVDQDNHATYSAVAVVKAGALQNSSVAIFPNPAKTNAALSIKSVINGMADIRVVNMLGATLYVQHSQVSQGENTIVLNNIGNLISGVYNVQVTLNNNNYFSRLLIQK